MRNNKNNSTEKILSHIVQVAFVAKNFSGWLVKEGFENVGQLHGGIATYGKDPETKGAILGW